MISELHLPFLILVWTALTIAIVRGLRRPRLLKGPAWSGWVQLICAGVVFSLQGTDVEQHIDDVIGGFPVTLTVKYGGMLLWFGLYFLVIKSVYPGGRLYPIAEGVLILAVAVGAFLIFQLAVADDSRRLMLRDFVTGSRDAFLLVPTVLIFIPATLRLAHAEQLPGMRSKQYAIVLCYSAYSVVALLNVQKGIAHVTLGAVPPPLPVLPSLAMAACVAGFVVLLVPYRWLAGLLYPTRLMTYWRLRKREQHILKLAGITAVQSGGSPGLIPGRQLELAIYRSTINILDYGVLVPDGDGRHSLASQLRDIATKTEPYEALVDRLARMPI